MENEFNLLALKRKKQTELVNHLWQGWCNLSKKSDNDIRCLNLSKSHEGGEYDFVVKKGVSFAQVYEFAFEVYRKTNRNILNEPLGVGNRTLLWDAGEVTHLIYSRTMTASQYACCEKVVDMIFSGEYNSYDSVRCLPHMERRKS